MFTPLLDGEDSAENQVVPKMIPPRSAEARPSQEPEVPYSISGSTDHLFSFLRPLIQEE